MMSLGVDIDIGDGAERRVPRTAADLRVPYGRFQFRKLVDISVLHSLREINHPTCYYPVKMKSLLVF